MSACSAAVQPRQTTPRACAEPVAAPAAAPPATAPVVTAQRPCDKPLVPIVRAQPNEQPGWLIGAVCGTSFLRARDAAPFIADEAYRVLSVREYPRAATGTPPRADATASCPDVPLVTLTPAPQLGEWLAIGGAWPLAPYSLQTPAIEPRHEQAVRTLLAARGRKDAAVVITQLLRADLEHDGSSDDLISATVGGVGGDGEAGAYSLVLLQRVHEGVTTDITLEISVPVDSKAGLHSIFRINDLLDLNGDGTLEILIERGDTDGWGVSVFDPAGNRTAVGERCGA